MRPVAHCAFEWKVLKLEVHNGYLAQGHAPPQWSQLSARRSGEKEAPLCLPPAACRLPPVAWYHIFKLVTACHVLRGIT